MAIQVLSGSNSVLNFIPRPTEHTKKKNGFQNRLKSAGNIPLTFKKAQIAVTRFSSLLFRKLFPKQNTTKTSFRQNTDKIFISNRSNNHYDNSNNHQPKRDSLPLESKILPINLHELWENGQPAIATPSENNTSVTTEKHLPPLTNSSVISQKTDLKIPSSSMQSNTTDSLTSSLIQSIYADKSTEEDSQTFINSSSNRSSLTNSISSLRSQLEYDDTSLNSFISGYAKQHRDKYITNQQSVLYNSFLSNKSDWENNTYQSTMESDSLNSASTFTSLTSVSDNDQILTDDDSDSSSTTSSLKEFRRLEKEFARQDNKD